MSSIPKPKEPKEQKEKGKKKGKMPKNIKIDNITFDGDMGDIDWNDFIKVNNGA